MKNAVHVAGVVGILCLVVAFIGRFRGGPEIWVLGQSHSATTFILLANTFFLMSLCLAACSLGKCSSAKATPPADAAKPKA